ncbi:MAG: hypothetical protein H6Q15_1842, partial [Bacteroidetes bacterium]|nr:hypothetical protein [Bacteroidota bacterium]
NNTQQISSAFSLIVLAIINTKTCTMLEKLQKEGILVKRKEKRLTKIVNLFEDIVSFALYTIVET